MCVTVSRAVCSGPAGLRGSLAESAHGWMGWFGHDIKAATAGWGSWSIYLSIYLSIQDKFRLNTFFKNNFLFPHRFELIHSFYQWFPESLAGWWSLPCRAECPPKQTPQTTDGSPATEICRGVSSVFFQSEKPIRETGRWPGRQERLSAKNEFVHVYMCDSMCDCVNVRMHMQACASVCRFMCV